jgi:hypothetical protein
MTEVMSQSAKQLVLRLNNGKGYIKHLTIWVPGIINVLVNRDGICRSAYKSERDDADFHLQLGESYQHYDQLRRCEYDGIRQ